MIIVHIITNLYRNPNEILHICDSFISHIVSIELTLLLLFAFQDFQAAKYNCNVCV